jgi:2-C-methyl-D-erythritol 4-phosphate cytidylyltransferase
MVQWSVDALGAVDAIGSIVVALPAEGEAEAPPGTIGVRGGPARSASVRNALAASQGDPVLVHDAARPFVTAELAQRCLAMLAGDDGGGPCDAAIAAAPVTDTIKRAAADGTVRETLDRSELWAIQTPQVFRRAALERALDVPAEVLAAATDDASLVERAGGTVRVVPAPAENVKVTTPADLRAAERALRDRAGAC